MLNKPAGMLFLSAETHTALQEAWKETDNLLTTHRSIPGWQMLEPNFGHSSGLTRQKKFGLMAELRTIFYNHRAQGGLERHFLHSGVDTAPG